MANRHTKRRSASLVIGDCTSNRSERHLPPVRVAITSKSTNECGQDVEKRELLCAVGANAAAGKSSIERPQKIKNVTA